MKKIYTLILLLVTLALNIYAQDSETNTTGQTLTISSSNGSLNKTGFANTWTSSTSSPTVTLTASANNMQSYDAYLDLRSGAGKSSTYTIVVGRGKISSYKITGYALNASYDQTITPTGKDAITFTNNNNTPTTQEVTLTTPAASTQFVLTDDAKNGNKGLAVTSIEITLAPVTDEIFSIKAIGAPTGVTYAIDNTTIDTPASFTAKSDAIASDLTVTLPEGTTNISPVVTLNKDTFTVTYTYNGTVDFSSNIGSKAKFSDPATSIETDKWYLLYQNRGGNGYVYNNNGTYYKGASSNFTTGTEITNANYSYIFHFIKTDDGYYYIQGADGKFFGLVNNNELTGVNTGIPASDIGYPFTISTVTADDNTYYYLRCSNNVIIDNNGNGGTIAGWGTTKPSETTSTKAWRFYPVEFEYTVTWNIKEKDSDTDPLVSFESTTTKGGDATYTLPTYPYTSLSTPEGSEATISDDGTVATVSNVTENKDVTLIATFSEPFATSKDYDNAIWQYINNKSTGYIYYSDNDTKLEVSSTFDNSDSYKWAFIGNPIQGYQIINKGQGDGRDGRYVNAKGTDTNAETTISDSKQSPVWMIDDVTKTEATKDNTGYFTFHINGYTNYWNYYNNKDGQRVAMWNEIDKNSCWKAEMPLPKEGTYLRIKNKSTGAYIISPVASSAITGNSSAETTKLIASNTETGAASIWYYTTANSANGILSYYSGAYAISNSYGSGTAKNGNAFICLYNYKTPNSGNNYIYDNTTNFPGTYQICVKYSGWGYFGNKTGSSDVISTATNTDDDNTNDINHAWTLEEVTELPVTLHQSGTSGTEKYYYGTLALPVTVDLPEGTTAYAVGDEFTRASDNVTAVKLTSIGTTIPANTAVVLVNENTDKSTDLSLKINVTVSTNTTASLPDDVTNNLQPILKATTYVDNSNYYFGQKNNTPGFYQVTGGSGYYLTNKGFLAGTTSSSKGFAFAFGDDDPTGINGASAENGGGLDVNAPMYNLQGVRVPTWYKGIVVQNGQKYLLK